MSGGRMARQTGKVCPCGFPLRNALAFRARGSSFAFLWVWGETKPTHEWEQNKRVDHPNNCSPAAASVLELGYAGLHRCTLA